MTKHKTDKDNTMPPDLLTRWKAALVNADRAEAALDAVAAEIEAGGWSFTNGQHDEVKAAIDAAHAGTAVAS